MKPLITASALILGSVAGAVELMPINDLRVGVALGLAPTVTEEVRTDTTDADYDWSGNQGLTVRYQVDYFNGLSRRGVARPGFIWGLGALYSDTDIRPSSYDQSGGASIPNQRKRLGLQYRQYGASLYAGYATMPHITEYGEWTLEFLPVVRGGYAWSETVDGANDRTEAGGGTFWEGGAQVGWTLQDKGWLLNVFAGYTYGTAVVPIAITGGDSTLTITRSSPEIGLTVGGRF